MQTTINKTLFRLIWWDGIQMKAQAIDLPFSDSKAAWDFLMTIPGLDTYKKCGAFPIAFR